MEFLSWTVAGLSLITAALKYSDVAVTGEPKGRQMLHLLPSPAYVLVGFAALFLPNLIFHTLVLLLVCIIIDKGTNLWASFQATKYTDPPSTRDWYYKLRFIPWVFGVTVLLYVIVARNRVELAKYLPTAKPKPQTFEPVKPKVSTETQDEQATWDSLKAVQP